MSSIRLKITCIVTMKAGPQLTLQTAKNTSMFSAQHTSNSNSYQSKKCHNGLLAHQRNLLLFWVMDLISLILAKSTGQPPLSMIKHRFPTKSQSTCQYHLCKNLRISCARQKSVSVFISTWTWGKSWQPVVGMLWYKYGWECFRARMSGQSSSEIIRRWSLIGRWRMEEEDKLEWDRERKYFI
jgi:hypothetical protein